MRTLTKARRLKEALHVWNHPGIQEHSNTYGYLLQECIKMKDLAGGKQLHAHIIQSGCKPSIFLLNTLVNMYAKCGSLMDARRVFDKMPERDLFTWNIMIGGYAKRSCGREALEIYEQMQWEKVPPDKVTFTCVLNACASLRALERGRQVHCDISKSGIVVDIILQNTLADMYAKCGRVTDAHQLFSNMAERDVVSWNGIIAGYVQHGCGREAFGIYEQMIQEGVMPDKVTFICLLNVCASLRALEKGKEVHADMDKWGIVPDVILENTLADMYAKCGSVEDARHVFDKMAKRTVVSWNVILAAYVQHGCGRDAVEIYEQMKQEGVMADRVTFTCILNVCTSLGALAKGKEVHADMSKSGIVPDLVVENSLVDMYAKCGSMRDALEVFNNMVERNVVSWSAMISGYAQHGCGRQAISVYKQMHREEVMPNRVTFIYVLNACASVGALEEGKEVHANISKAGIAPDIILETALVDMYAKCGSISNARQVFDNMAERNAVSWSVMIAAYAQHGCGREAFEIYEQMQQKGVTADRVTFTCVLNACTSLAALAKGKEVHADIIKAGIVPDIILETALAAMYTKCGSLKEACQVFDNMAQRNVISWNVMIAGSTQHGCSREAMQLFEQMQQEGLKPDGITFISILSACSHVGLVDEGHHYFDSLSRDHGLTPTVEHCGCMVDLLGRAGRLDEAEDFIKKLPMEPDASVWGTLLAACKMHGDVQLAECAANHLLKWDTQQAGT